MYVGQPGTASASRPTDCRVMRPAPAASLTSHSCLPEPSSVLHRSIELLRLHWQKAAAGRSGAGQAGSNPGRSGPQNCWQQDRAVQACRATHDAARKRGECYHQFWAAGRKWGSACQGSWIPPAGAATAQLTRRPSHSSSLHRGAGGGARRVGSAARDRNLSGSPGDRCWQACRGDWPGAHSPWNWPHPRRPGAFRAHCPGSSTPCTQAQPAAGCPGEGWGAVWLRMQEWEGLCDAAPHKTAGARGRGAPASRATTCNNSGTAELACITRSELPARKGRPGGAGTALGASLLACAGACRSGVAAAVAGGRQWRAGGIHVAVVLAPMISPPCRAPAPQQRPLTGTSIRLMRSA